MASSDHHHDSSSVMGGKRLIKPGEPPDSPGKPKLPLPTNETFGDSKAPEEVRQAWVDYMVHGFKNNELMFKRTLEAFMKPYHLTVWIYGVLFVLGIVLVIVAVVMGLRDGSSPAAIVFAGLGTGSFLLFFIRQPVQALEENLEFITWLGVAFNTYWTRLMYVLDSKMVQQEIKAADDDYSKTVERLIARHAELRGKRPGGDIESSKSVERG
jgi:hypothetical protein